MKKTTSFVGTEYKCCVVKEALACLNLDKRLTKHQNGDERNGHFSILNFVTTQNKLHMGFSLHK